MKRLRFKNSEGETVIHPSRVIKETKEEFILDFPFAPLHLKKKNLREAEII